MGNAIPFCRASVHTEPSLFAPECPSWTVVPQTRASAYTVRRKNPGLINFIVQQLVSFSIIIARFPLHTNICISSHASKRKRHISVRFTGHFTLVGPHYGTHFMSPFLRLKFGYGSQIVGKFGDHCICQYYNAVRR